MTSSTSGRLDTSPNRSRNRLGTLLARVAILAAVLVVVPGWLTAIGEARKQLRSARKEPFVERIAKERGPGFLEAVEKVRASVPPEGSYILEVDPYGRGSLTAIALRHAVLPRKPILLQRYVELKGEPAVRPRVTVFVEDDETAPSVLEWTGLVERFDPSALGTRDDSLLGSVDEVHFDPDGRVRVRGWCQGDDAVRCDVAAVLVNGRPAPLSEVTREPRPAVEAALPRVGPCPRAGYRFTLPRGVATGDRVSVEAIFRTVDGRWRIYPEQFARRSR